MISVAICTHNGEKYIKEQIESILSQTILPDEIIICDDVSTDNTINIIKDINNPIIKLHQNPKNLRTTKNFEQAIKMCSGDVIFLSDQDDVWVADKIKIITEAFNSNPEAYMIFTDAYVANEKLELFDYSLWEYHDFDYSKFGPSLLMKKWVATGATIAIKKEALEFIIPFPDDMLHDSWITFILAFLGHAICVDKKLIYYRQHTNQQVGVSIKRHSLYTNLRKKLFGVSLRHDIIHLPYLKTCQAHLNHLPIHKPASYSELADYINHLETRANLPDNKIARWKAISKEIPKYLKYDVLLTPLKDWLAI